MHFLQLSARIIKYFATLSPSAVQFLIAAEAPTEVHLVVKCPYSLENDRLFSLLDI